MPYRASAERGVTLTFLGTGSGVPGAGRGMSASLLTSHDRFTHYLFDCGEGTQGALSRASDVHPKWLWKGAILVSHLHGDHVFGLPSLLTGMLRDARSSGDGGGGGGGGSSGSGSGGASSVLRVFGPPGLHRFLSAAFGASHSDAFLASMPLRIHELHWAEGNAACGGTRAAVEGGGGSGGLPLRVHHADATGVFTCIANAEHTVRAAPLLHSVPCLGYVYAEADEVHLDPAALRARGVEPGPGIGAALAALKAGRPAAFPGRGGGVVRLSPSDVLRYGSKGRKVALFSDMSRPSAAALALAAGADVLVHEATLEAGEESKAAARGHATPVMAGRTAAAIKPRHLLLTHFRRPLGAPVIDPPSEGEG